MKYKTIYSDPPFVEIFARPKINNEEIFINENPIKWNYIGNQADGTIF